MAESRTSRFLRFLSRIRSTQPLSVEDVESVSHLSVNSNDGRVEEEIHHANQEEQIVPFLKQGFRTYRSADLGLAALGWKEIPVRSGPEIPRGSCGWISLAYKLSDQGLPLESRHLTAAKIQSLFTKSLARPSNNRTYIRVWKEVEILKGLVHENIVGFYGMFAVYPELDTDHTDRFTDTYPDYRDFWILLEYASAGDLSKEIRRYKTVSIPEPGARYYMLQICAGVQYMHSKRIIHFDLHTGNILLKYKPDGTKVCMLCDFGLCKIVEPDVPIDCRGDVTDLRRILESMMMHTSKEADQVIRGHREGHSLPTTIAELLDFPWFAGPVHAPIPKEPTPLLRPEVVKQIGYLPPLAPAGTSSKPRVAHPPPGEIEVVAHAHASTSSSQRVILPPPHEIEKVTRSDSRGGSFAHRIRERLRSIPHHVRSRIRSLPCVGGRAERRGSEPEFELEEQPSRRRHNH